MFIIETEVIDMNIFVEYPKCSTCKTARKFLEENGFSFDSRDIKEDRLNKEELRTLVQKSGLPIRKFFNTSGLKYKELNLKEKLPTMNEEEMLELLASDGMLVKRPIFICEDQVVVGKKEKEYLALKK